MQNDNKVSIVIPTIGSSPIEYLIESLDSALAVANHPLLDKIFIIDNSNDENLNNLFLKYSAKNDKFEHHRVAEKLSMAECWNKGLEVTTSRWVLYLHDDDILNIKEFMKINSNELNHDVGFIAFDFHTLIENSISLVSIKSGVEGIIRNTPKFVSTIYNTERLKSIGGWDEKAGYALDLLALVKLCHLFGDYKINRCLGRYRIHTQNSSSLDKRSKAYGDAIPYIFAEIFSLIEDQKIRKLLAFHLFTFTYPNQTIFQKGINWVLRKFGLNAWIIPSV